MKHKFLRRVGPILSVCLFVLAIVLLHHELKDSRLEDIVNQLRQVGPGALLSAVALTTLKYLLLTAGDALALRHVRHPVAYLKLAFASFVGCSFTNAATFVGGGAARYRIYSTFGLSGRKIAEMVLFFSYTFWLGFLLVAGAVFVSAPQAAIPAGLPVSQFEFRILGLICLTLVGAYLLAVCLWRRPLTIRGWQLRVPSVALSAGQIAVTAVDWLLAAAVLYVLLPSQMDVPFVGFLGIFMVGQGAGMIAHIPGGLGVFETVLLYGLSDGRDVAALTAALLLYRLIYYLLPLLLGSILLALHGVLPQGLPADRHGLSVRRTGETSFAPTLPLEGPD
jgi:uncharacterized membrane protein YbhN (UPF0104 family)